ncbi:hypothetical protein EJB05_45072, partial [Eragrostis curvula]
MGSSKSAEKAKRRVLRKANESLVRPAASCSVAPVRESTDTSAGLAATSGLAHEALVREECSRRRKLMASGFDDSETEELLEDNPDEQSAAACALEGVDELGNVDILSVASGEKVHLTGGLPREVGAVVRRPVFPSMLDEVEGAEELLEEVEDSRAELGVALDAAFGAMSEGDTVRGEEQIPCRKSESPPQPQNAGGSHSGSSSSESETSTSSESGYSSAGAKSSESEPQSDDAKFVAIDEFVKLAKKCDHRELLEYLQNSDDASVVELLDRNASMAALASGVLCERLPRAASGSAAEEASRLRRENASLLEEQASLKAISADFEDQLAKRDDALAALKELIQSHEEEIAGLRARLKTAEEDRETALERAKSAEDSSENLKAVSQKLAKDFAKGAGDIHACLTEILDRFGGEPNPLPAVPGLLLPADFFKWLRGELGDLPDVLDNVGYFSAKTGCFALLDLLEKKGCQHFPDFGRGSYSEANFGMVDTDNDSKSVRVVLSRFMRCYWRVHGVPACRRIAERKFEEMRLKLQGSSDADGSKDAPAPKRPPPAPIEEPLAKAARVEGSGSADNSSAKAPLVLKTQGKEADVTVSEGIDDKE